MFIEIFTVYRKENPLKLLKVSTQIESLRQNISFLSRMSSEDTN